MGIKHKILRLGAVLAASFGHFGAYCPGQPGEDLLAAYSFTALIPPSNMMTVGTVLAIEEEEVSAGQPTSKYKLLCGPRASMGPDYVASSSQTINAALHDKKNTSWKLQGQVLDSLRASVNVDDVKSISVKLVNAKILSLTDADVLENLKNRSLPCRQAIAARIEQGFTVTMVSAALLADMNYEVEWRDSVKFDKRARIVEMQQLAANLGGGQRRVGLKTIESKGLALGIRTDAFLLALSMPDMKNPTANIIEQHEKERLQPDLRAFADPEPIVPLVLPRGGYVMPEIDMDND